MFLRYINDVTDIFSISCVGKLYADDIKLYSVLDNSLDYSDLQSNLNELQQWSDRWQLNISYKKCNVLFSGAGSISKVGGAQIPALSAVKIFLLCPPHFFVVPPHDRAL